MNHLIRKFLQKCDINWIRFLFLKLTMFHWWKGKLKYNTCTNLSLKKEQYATSIMSSIHKYEWLEQYKELLRKVLSSKRKRFQSSAYMLWESNNMKWLTEKLRTQNIKIANQVEWKVLQFYNAVKIEFHIISECRWLRQCRFSLAS